MSYKQQYEILKDLFQTDQDVIKIPGSQTVIRNMEFESKYLPHSTFLSGTADNQINENIKFRYPVFLPQGKLQHRHAILFLHGLNERSWSKHLTGARYLAESTGCAVILFPLSFHINRGLPEWIDVRKMSKLLETRKMKYPDIKDATVVNLALSERLTEFPERFYNSGQQSAMDMISLMRDIQGGNHPLFEKGTKTDLFAYSISCMMLQTLMIINPDDLLSNSRIVFFAGGSIFSHLQGVSRYIMDSVAFDAMKKFYINVFGENENKTGTFRHMVPDSAYGRAFKAVIAPDLFRNVREKAMAFFADRLMLIALRNDRIIPLNGIRQAMGNKFFHSRNCRIVHFPYDYSHENPFPVLYDHLDQAVEKAFHSVYDPARTFFTP